MRLGQLSRKISVRQPEIVSFLTSKGITIEDNSNARVSDNVVAMVVSHLAPAIPLHEVLVVEVTKPVDQPETIAELPSVPAPVEAEVVQPSEEVESPPEKMPEIVEEVSAVESSSIPTENEVIRAPKVELQGLKVIGKIDLPQPKKKESASTELAEGDANAASDVPEPRKRQYEKRKPAQRERQKNPRHNPIALQREREAKEAEEKRRDQKLKEKEKRTQYYQQRLKSVAPPKRVAIVDEPLGSIEDEAPDRPATWWGKFVHWLKGH